MYVVVPDASNASLEVTLVNVVVCMQAARASRRMLPLPEPLVAKSSCVVVKNPLPKGYASRWYTSDYGGIRGV